jgi:hypothetical protein
MSIIAYQIVLTFSCPCRYTARFKKFLKDYGTVGVVTHSVVSTTFFGGCYLAVKYGFDAKPLLDTVGLGDKLGDSTLGTLGVAFILNKLGMPIRYTATFLLTPRVKRYYDSSALKPYLQAQRNKWQQPVEKH